MIADEFDKSLEALQNAIATGDAVAIEVEKATFLASIANSLVRVANGVEQMANPKPISVVDDSPPLVEMFGPNHKSWDIYVRYILRQPVSEDEKAELDLVLKGSYDFSDADKKIKSGNA